MAQNGCKSGANGSVHHFVKDERQSEGVDQSVFDGIMKAIVEDRPAYFSAFFKAFFNVDVLLGDHQQ